MDEVEKATLRLTELDREEKDLRDKEAVQQETEDNSMQEISRELDKIKAFFLANVQGSSYSNRQSNKRTADSDLYDDDGQTGPQNKRHKR